MRESGLQYTLTSANGYALTINPTNFSGDGYYAKTMIVSSSLRAAMVDKPQQHGSYIDPGYEGGLAIEAACYMLASSAASRQSLSDSAMKVLRDIAVNGNAVLVWTPQDGSSARQVTDIALSAAPAIANEGGTVKSWAAMLKSAKPYSESATATTLDTASFGASGGGFTIPLRIPFSLAASGAGTLTYTNSGTVPVMPVLRVYGPATAPVVTNVSTSQSLSFTGNIASGDFWEIDLFARTVFLNGGTSDAPLHTLSSSTSSWFACGIGDSTLQLTCSGYDTTNTKLRAYVRSAWG